MMQALVGHPLRLRGLLRLFHARASGCTPMRCDQFTSTPTTLSRGFMGTDSWSKSLDRGRRPCPTGYIIDFVLLMLVLVVWWRRRRRGWGTVACVVVVAEVDRHVLDLGLILTAFLGSRLHVGARPTPCIMFFMAPLSACRMLIGACAPILRPIHVSRCPISDRPESGLTAASRGTRGTERWRPLPRRRRLRACFPRRVSVHMGLRHAFNGLSHGRPGEQPRLVHGHHQPLNRHAARFHRGDGCVDDPSLSHGRPGAPEVHDNAVVIAAARAAVLGHGCQRRGAFLRRDIDNTDDPSHRARPFCSVASAAAQHPGTGDTARRGRRAREQTTEFVSRDHLPKLARGMLRSGTLDGRADDLCIETRSTFASLSALVPNVWLDSGTGCPQFGLFELAQAQPQELVAVGTLQYESARRFRTLPPHRRVPPPRGAGTQRLRIWL